jgi:hypothetical protein
VTPFRNRAEQIVEDHMSQMTIKRPASPRQSHTCAAVASPRTNNALCLAARLLLGAVCLIALTAHAVAAEKPSLDARCAAKELETVMLIDRFGAAEEMSPEVLVDAFAVVGKARRTCQMGNVQDALALYESLGFSRVQSTRAE